MSKNDLKKKRLAVNGHVNDATGESFPVDIQLSHIDTHRENPKCKGGTYSKDNYGVVDPVSHMKHHGIHRIRIKELEELKTLLDARKPISKLKLASQNRLLSYKRWTDVLDERTVAFLENIGTDIVAKEEKAREKDITNHLKKIKHPLMLAAKNIKGVGPISMAYILTYIDITKARYASSLWAYAGYHTASDKRYVPGVAGGGNKTFRTALYVLAGSFMKQKESPYKDIYYAEKLKLSESEKLTLSVPVGGSGRKEMKWKDTTPNHRHQAAIRKMMKHFLADLWKVWRTLEGLDTPLLYPEAIMGHKGIVQPEERGWVLPPTSEEAFEELAV